MSDWDGDSKQLRANLRQALLQARNHASQRLTPRIEQAREWQRTTMQKLIPPRPEYVGRFRGDAGLEDCEVEIAGVGGTLAQEVAGELQRFEEKLQRTVEVLDALIAPNQSLGADEVAAVIDLAAWAHAEWVRIHPFANGNGRTARLWANYVAMRYGLPPFVRLRPRPDAGYSVACARAMHGRWQATVPVFREMYRKVVQR